MGRSFFTGLSSFFTTDFKVDLDERTERNDREPALCIDSVSESSPPISIALSNIERHPSAPPQPYIKSITSTTPHTRPSFSHTGNVKNLLSCMFCNASITDISGETVSGFGVITVLTVVRSEGSSLATTLDIMSLNPKIPTNSPLSTTKAAFFAGAINAHACLTVECGDTIVDGAPVSKLRKVGEALFPKA